MATKADIVDAKLEGNLNGNPKNDVTVTGKLAVTGNSNNTDVTQNADTKGEIDRNTDDKIKAKNSKPKIDGLMDSQGKSLTDDVMSTETGLTLKPDLKGKKGDSENPLPLIEGMKSDARMMKKIINHTAFKSRGTKRKRRGRVAGGVSRVTASTATTVASIDRGAGTMALSVGSKVEVKDFGDQWHPAHILEVDYDEMEVLVHYDNWEQRSDEWISVSSPRLRPAAVPPSRVTSVRVKTPGRATPPPLVYRVGERCLAKWSDNRRFLATVRAVLDEGQYEIIFDDGFVRVCKANLLSKLKQPETDVNGQMSADRSNASSPVDLPFNLPLAPILYHKHLFDPSRDYLGSKKERRDMKRKLNVKELFSAKKKRAEPAPKASKPKLKWKPGRKKGKAPVVRKRQKIDFMGDEVPSTSAVVEDSSIEKNPVEESAGEKEEIELAAPTKVVSELPEQPTNIIPAEEEIPPELTTPTPAGEKVPPKPETNTDKIATESTLTEAVLAAPQPQIKLERIRQKKETKRTAKREKKAERMKVKIKFKPTKAKKLDAGKVKEILAEDIVDTARSTTPVLSAEDILKQQKEIEEVVLGEGEWSCRWLNGQPVGVVSEIETQVVASEVSDGGSSASQQPLARRSVQVEDKRLPEGWTKHMVRRSHGNSAGKWDVVLVCPEGRRFRTRLEMRTYLVEQDKSELKAFEDCLLDFGVHRKRAKRLGWDVISSDTTQVPVPITLPANSLSAITSPIGRKKKLSLKKKDAGKIPPNAGIKKRRRGRKVRDVLGVVGNEGSVQPEMVQSDGIKVDESLMTIPTGDVTLGDATQDLPPIESSPLEEGYVYVGSLKVQMIDNLYYRCPKEGCLKNFRKDNLLRMHIKHYHREMRKLMGVTPKVADLAYARTITEDPPAPTPKSKSDVEKVHKPKTPKVPKINEADTPVLPKKDIDLTQRELFVNTETVDVNQTPLKTDGYKYETLEDSPKLRSALENEASAKNLQLQGVKLEFKEISELEDSKIKLELLDNTVQIKELQADSLGNNQTSFMDEDTIDEEGFKLRFDDEKSNEYLEDYEKSISAYTVPKELEAIPAPVEVPKIKRNKYEKKRLSQWKDGVKVSKKRRQPNVGVQQRKLHSELDVWDAFTSDADEAQSSFGNVGQHSRLTEKKTVSLALPQNMQEMVPTPVEPQTDNMFITESGEKIRIVRMKREEIINCHCGYGEEDGLMVQCELCLCWQHAICHNIERESQVPEKYVCAICTNPRRGRRSARWLHEQGWLYEGTLPSWAVSGSGAGGGREAALRRSHELVGNLLLLADALHAMRVKMQVAGKKDHPKLYLWSRSWEQPTTQEVAPEAIITETVSMDDDLVDMPKLDLNNLMESEVGKENCPISKLPMEHSPDADSALPRDGGSGDADGTSLVGLLGGNDALRLPISTSELERLAKSVQDCDALVSTSAPLPMPSAPEPEKAIDWAECRLRLLQHIERAQAAIDARLDSIEAQVAELESQDPSLEDDETADFYPQTKQTIQMLVRDLNTVEELALIT